MRHKNRLIIAVILVSLTFFSAPAIAQRARRSRLINTYVPSSGPANDIGPEKHFGKSVNLPRFRTINVPSGWGSDCGQYVVANIFSALGRKIDKAFYDQIGHEINPRQRGVALGVMKSYLSKQFHCWAFDHPKVPFRRDRLDILILHVASGNPVVAVVEVSKTLHWVIVNGFTLNHDDTIKSWSIEDNGVVRGIHSHKEFSKMWDCPNNPSVSRYCLLIWPNETTPIPRPLVEQKPVSSKRSETPFTLTTHSRKKAEQETSNSTDSLEQRIEALRKSLASILNPQQTVNSKTDTQIAKLGSAAPVSVTDTSSDDVANSDQYVLSESEFRKHLERLTKHNYTKPSERKFIQPFPGLEEERRELQLRLIYDYFNLSHVEKGLIKERLKVLKSLTTTPPNTSPERSLGDKARTVFAHFAGRADALDVRLPSAATVVFAVVAFVTLFPLLFIVLYSLNGKWLKK